jgi:replication fork clamp-binding protein CrfC
MNAPDPQGDVRAALELGVKASTAYERPDLVERLQATLAKVNRPEVQVVAVGEFKQGKSSLINALVNVDICPVDDDIATAVHTMVRYGAERTAYALTKPASDPDGPGERIPIPFDQIRNYATELGVQDPSILVKGVEIEVPRKLLGDGVILIDTPGVGGLGSAHSAAALAALSVADTALFVSDASQEYTRAEMGFLAQAMEMCPSVACVLTKVDLYPHWREVLEINQRHLARLGLRLPILPVSSLLRVEAIRRKDKEINAQSGFPSLVQYLTNDIVAANSRRNRAAAQRELLAVCEQLGGQFEAEKSALTDPAASAALVEGLERAKVRAEALRSQAARWSTTLNDGVSDLTSDVDFDLRGRMRKILSEADAAIEDFEPAKAWDDFEPWLTSSVSAAVVTNYRYLTERAAQLGRDVGSHFDADGNDLIGELEINNASNVMSKVSMQDAIEGGGQGLGYKGLTILRGSYSGYLMVGLLGNFVGTAMVPFVGIPLAFVLGRKALKEERERQLARQRSEAKNAVRRYCDDVSFQVNKDSKDTLRRIQRQLRDHYTARANEIQKSTSEALKSATEAQRVAAKDRERRLRDVAAELGRIKTLRERAEKLMKTPAGAAR